MEKILAEATAAGIVVGVAGAGFFIYGKYKAIKAKNNAMELRELELKQMKKEEERRQARKQSE